MLSLLLRPEVLMNPLYGLRDNHRFRLAGQVAHIRGLANQEDYVVDFLIPHHVF